MLLTGSNNQSWNYKLWIIFFWRKKLAKAQKTTRFIRNSWKFTIRTFEIGCWIRWARYKCLITKNIFQGYEEDDDDVEIVMEVEVNEDKEKFTDFFWLIQKSIKIYENDKKCLGSGRRENCYFARRRKKISGTEYLYEDSKLLASVVFFAEQI